MKLRDKFWLWGHPEGRLKTVLFLLYNETGGEESPPLLT